MGSLPFHTRRPIVLLGEVDGRDSCINAVLFPPLPRIEMPPVPEGVPVLPEVRVKLVVVPSPKKFRPTLTATLLLTVTDELRTVPPLTLKVPIPMPVALPISKLLEFKVTPPANVLTPRS